MKKFLAILLLIACVMAATAQEKPVQFVFSTERANDSIVLFKAKANISKGLQIFSANKRSEEDAFISTISFDSSFNKWRRATDTITEIGSAIEARGELSYRSFADSVTFVVPLHISVNDSVVALKGDIAWLGKKGDEFPSGGEAFNAKLADKKTADAAATKGSAPAEEPLSGIALFLFCFLTGLAAVFTPCVFPLIPVTVSFFLKKSKTKGQGVRNAWWYALCIILIYTIPTIILTLIFGDKFLYQVSTHPISNLLFFAIFIVFAISFFGAFELTLPGSWATKADEGAGKGGMMGIFFMALTLVIVSFSCTGPIVAGLLSQTSGQGIGMGPVIGMAGFGLGLAIPFGIFALFPSMLKSLPKSGGWLNTVKVFFGFIELALALKFFSNVDQAYHWGILNREVFIVVWVVIFFLLGLYLLGKLKFSHDSDLPYISVPRLFIAIASWCFALYMVPGLWGAPLTPLSGILPSPSTQEFNLNDLQYKIGSGSSHSQSNVATTAPAPKKYIDKFHVPFGLTAYYDMEEALAAARILKKPVMIDFTGWSCANCRKMENEVWSKPEVLKKMKEDFVLVSLFVDDKTELEESEKVKKPNGEMINTIGDKNLDYEQTTFNLNAQPLYKFVDLEGKPLSDVQYGYDNDIPKFLAHLETVKAEFKKRHP
ncbi:MAG: thioredoxin family protein [Bacteroidota bacterium]